MSHFLRLLTLLLLALIFITACGDSGTKPTSSTKKKLTIGIVAKSVTNPVFQAAHAGAKEAARELGAKHNVDVSIDWRTPAEEDPQKQSEAIEALTRQGVQGIAVSCSEANTVTPAIDRAVGKGVVVICFDSDAPTSKRL